MFKMGMRTEDEFFKLFHEPFATWLADLDAIRGRELWEECPDDELVHVVSLVERLTELMSQEYREHFSFPLPGNLWSAGVSRDQFREMNAIARDLLLQRGSRLKPKTRHKLTWLAELTLDAVLRGAK